jgi:ATP-binding cassette subfamily B protein
MFHGMHQGGGGVWWSLTRANEQAQPKLTRDLLRRVADYARPYRFPISIALLTIFISSLLGLVPPLLYRDLIDHALPQRDWTRLNLLALGMIGIPLISGLVDVAQRWLTASIGEGIISDLRKALYAHMQKMSLRFFTNTKTGELMSRLNNDVVGAQRAVTSTLISIITSVFQLVTALFIMLSLDWRLTLLSLIVLPLFVLPSRRIGHILREIVRRQLDLNAEMNALMSETLNVSGALLVKLFGRQGDEERKFDERANRVRDIGVRQALVGRWFFMALALVSAFGTAMVWWAGGMLVLQGSFTIGTIVAFAAYLAQLYSPLSALVNARVDFATSMVSFERVFEMLDLPVEIQDRPAAIELTNVPGQIRFDQVSFSYLEEQNGDSQPATKDLQSTDGDSEPPPGPSHWQTEGREGVSLSTDSADSADRDQQAAGALASSSLQAPENGERDARDPGLIPFRGGNGHGGLGAESLFVPKRRWALRDVSFTIQAGQLAALVGPSGAGKTTITYLIPRLYDPTSGFVEIDGHDLRDVKLESLTQLVGMVTQETFLFHDTVRTNLLYAKPDATQEEIEQACLAANIHDFIAGLPQGYETIVGERGYRLSGGEKQRIAIARVILKNPRILVLDEATSSLDSESEALIQAALKPLMQGRTSVVIAHRLSTILSADVILVIEEGSVVEQGNHAELLAQNGLYARLYNTQFRAQLAGVPGAESQ